MVRLWSFACLAAICRGQNLSNFDLVNPLIGSVNGGNVFAGATLPYGMAKATPDVSGQNTAGWSYDMSNVTGFSSFHDSGTGGQPSMGLFPLSVQPYCPGDKLENCQYGSKYERAVNYLNGSVKARPGYFALALENGVEVEMSTSQRAAVYNFHFPSNISLPSMDPLVILDLTDLQDSRQNASVKVDPGTGRITANGTFLPSFGVGSYQAYTCVDFWGGPVRETGVWVNERAGTEPKELFVNRGYSLSYIQAGAFVRFRWPNHGNLIARVGVSFVSEEQACQNGEEMIPGMGGVSHTARDIWKDKLSFVSIEPGGASRDLQETFFTGIYRTMISPQNYTGENQLWESAAPYFDSFYCIWDSFRSDFPYLTIADPKALTQMIQSLLDTYKNLGWLPDCRMQFCKGYSQGGSNADVVLADAYVKNLSASEIDWNLAYEAVVNDAENEPFDWGVEGRGGLQSWKQVGYVPVLDYDYLGFGPPFHSISRTVEYAYNDFCVAQIAQGLGHETDQAKYLQRSGNWRNLFKANQTSYWPNGTDTGFTGFPQPRYANGTWRYQDPIECAPFDSFCSYSSNPKETFESAIWTYQFYAPHAEAELVELFGGPDGFVQRLDFLHTSGLLEIGNEPSELNTYQYHYAGRPGRSSYRIHTYIPSTFNASIDGLPGNDDSGASGSFLAFALSGLFPVAGQDVYLLTPPFFESVSYKNNITGNVATIRNANFDPTYDAIYIQSATLDGSPYTKSWIGHDFFLRGGVLEFTLGSEERDWGTSQQDLPPSVATHSSKYRRSSCDYPMGL